MKRLLSITIVLLCTSTAFTQGQNWKISGNTISPGDYLGTNNNEPLIFKANGNEGLRIKPNGDLRIKGFDDNTFTGLVFVNSNGVLSKLNFTGNSNDVLLGNGTFGTVGNLTGWFFSGTNIYSTYNVGIGTNITPEKLTVNGNILANGSISGTSLNVVDIVGAGKEFKISTSLCMKGIDVNDPNSRNELCGMNGDLFIQSEHNNNYNTVFGLGNGSRTGFGIIPTEKFHVGTDARFEGSVNFSGISTVNDGDLLYIDTDGKIARGGGPSSIAFGAYNLDCRTDANGNILPTWHTGSGKLTTGGTVCEYNVLVGINTDVPVHSLHNVGGSFLNGIVGIGGNPTSKNTWLYIESNNGDDAIRYNTSTGTQFKVDASGKVTARDLKVTLNNIPDYVFKAEYKLPTINEQESYINANGHLLNVPSENEMIENETSIGELEMINLRLNEEQMLYLIQISKRLDKLEEENAELKKKVNSQEETINTLQNK